MDISKVLKHLQAQFPGQLVLYVEDIAKILGKSSKATSNLISRNGLPFPIKKVGGLRCADIFQVAEWLAGDTEATQEVVGAIGNVSVDLAAGKKRRKQSGRPGLTAHNELPQQKTPGLMAAQILQMRHDYSAPFERFVSGLRDPDELAFMYDVLAGLFFSGGALASSWVVTIRKSSPTGFKVRGEQSAKYFDSEERAILFLVSRLEQTKFAKSKRHLVHFVLTHLNDTLFHDGLAQRGGVVQHRTRTATPARRLTHGPAHSLDGEKWGCVVLRSADTRRKWRGLGGAMSL